MDEMISGGEQVEVGGIGPSGGGASGGEVPSTPALGGGDVPSGSPSPSPEQLYDVKVGGKTFKVGLNELLNGYSRHSDYTRKAQELAARERDWTTRLSHYEKAIQETRALLSDRARLAQILQQLPQGEAEEGDELLTRGQVEAMRQKWFEEFEQRQQQKLMAERYSSEVESLKQNFLGELKGVYDSMAEQYPLLKKLPLFNELRLKVGTFEPQSIADAKALLANEIRELAKENGWEAGSQAQRAPIPGIEPPGGAGVMPPSNNSYSSVRDPRLKNDVLRDIEQIMRASVNS